MCSVKRVAWIHKLKRELSPNSAAALSVLASFGSLFWFYGPQKKRERSGKPAVPNTKWLTTKVSEYLVAKYLLAKEPLTFLQRWWTQTQS